MDHRAKVSRFKGKDRCGQSPSNFRVFGDNLNVSINRLKVNWWQQLKIKHYFLPSLVKKRVIFLYSIEASHDLVSQRVTGAEWNSYLVLSSRRAKIFSGHARTMPEHLTHASFDVSAVNLR